MFNLLGIFSSLKEFIILLIVLVAITTLFLILFKFKNGKWFLLGLCGLALLVCGVFTAYANYEYFTIKGGTFGSFGDIFENKNKLMQNELKFDFENFVLIASGINDNEFSARLAIDAVNQKMTDKTIFVNDIPTKTINRGDNYIFSEYNYTFYDENLKEKCSDTLTIKFVFNSKSSECILTTQGGIDKVAHWNYFLKKNNFIVEIKKYDYIQNTELKVDDEINHTLTLYFEDELIDIIKFNITSPATLPTTYNGFAITSWKDADGNVYTQSNLPNQDLTLYAAEYRLLELKFNLKDNYKFEIATNDNDKLKYRLYYQIKCSELEKQVIKNNSALNPHSFIEFSNLNGLNSKYELSGDGSYYSSEFIIQGSEHYRDGLIVYIIFDSFSEEYCNIIVELNFCKTYSSLECCYTIDTSTLSNLYSILQNDYKNQKLSFNIDFSKSLSNWN